jgi:hypothetical protein
MTYYMKSGNQVTITDSESIDITTKLPVDTYAVRFNAQAGKFYLETVDSFREPKKLYGDVLTRRDRIMNTFQSRNSSTGVMLVGEKGSGKTMLARLLSIGARDAGMSTLLVSSPFCGDAFNKFVQDIDQPCMFLFDEYEKTYGTDDQEQLLSLFDGVFPTKKLFVVTSNSLERMDAHVMNRPGRMFYRYDYTGLDVDFIQQYCEDNLHDKNMVEKVIQASILYDAFNFDVLQAMVEEMNRYDETPSQVLKVLNIRPAENNRWMSFKVFSKETQEEMKYVYPSGWNLDPFKFSLNLEYCLKEEQKYRAKNQEQVRFGHSNMVKVDAANKRFIFEVKDLIIVAERVAHSASKQAVDYLDY